MPKSQLKFFFQNQPEEKSSKKFCTALIIKIYRLNTLQGMRYNFSSSDNEIHVIILFDCCIKCKKLYK
jgi:hypothetical protein